MKITDKIYTDETAARQHLEKLLWPNGPLCPHCGSLDAGTKLKGKSTRPGVYWCNGCQKPYSVTVGTVMERSHIPLHKWLFATQLLSSSKKGISAHQLMRMLGIGSYRSAWFLAHRIREAMAPNGSAPPLGGDGGAGKVEVDETYYGRKKGRTAPKGGSGHKHAVVALVERGGRVRSFYMPTLQHSDMIKVLKGHVAPTAHLRTDESTLYGGMDKRFASHQTVTHTKDEYVRGDASTNTIEGVFSIFKRGMIGTYQHCGEQHLQRYLNEFDFRYSNRARLGVDDAARADLAMKGTQGKRLTYRRINGA